MTIRDWITMWNGRFIDEDGAYGNQCWDLAQKYCREIIGCPRLPTRPGGNGFAFDIYDYFLAPLPQYFNRIENNPNNPNQVPLTGDLIIFRNSLGGHVAVVLKAIVGQPTLTVFHQNSPVGAAPQTGTLTYDDCIGWLAPKNRPKFDKESAPISEPVLATPSMPSTEFYTIREGNTFWGLEEVWDLPHGTLQSLNAGQDPRKLRIGQQIRIRPGAPAVPVAPPAPKKPKDNAKYHTIVAGDTFWDLENDLGLPHGRLQSLNPDQNPRTLQIGQKILIEPGTPDPEAPKDPPTPPAPKVSAALVDTPEETTSTTPVSAAIDQELNEAQVMPPIMLPANETAALSIDQPRSRNFWQKHFNKDKIMKDLAALGVFFGAIVAFLADNTHLVGPLLSVLAGIIFGGNRFKIGK